MSLTLFVSIVQESTLLRWFFDAMVQVVIKPTLDCNLKCTYCNLELRSRARITLEKVKGFLSLVSEENDCDTVFVRWHGGEPLLMGKDFFRNVFQWQENSRTRYKNAISTNLILLDEEYLSLFKENDTAIYTSLDGLERSHDHQRGKSFERVNESLFKLKNYGIKKVTVRSTITKYTVNEMHDLFGLCSTLGFSWDFGLVMPGGLRRVQALKLLVEPAEFIRNSNAIYDLWLHQEAPVDIPLFSNLISFFINRDEYLVETKPRMSIGPDGTVYACPLLIGKKEHAVTAPTASSAFNKFHNLTCSARRVPFSACDNCYFDFFCKLTHCTYLAKVYDSFPDLPTYVCHSWKPVYEYIYNSFLSEISPTSN